MEGGELVAHREMDWFRDRIWSSRYWLSEHVVRFLVRGKVSVAGIEAVLGGGELLEEWRNPKRATSYLVCGGYAGRPLHLVCSQDANRDLVVLFAYTPALPVWEAPTRRNPMGGVQMADAVGICFFCGGLLVEITVGNYFYRHEGQMCIVKRLPATLCEQCGEKYIAAGVGRKLNELIDGKKFSGTEEANVIEFQPEAVAP